MLHVCQQRKTPQLTWNNALVWPRTPKGTNTKSPTYHKPLTEVRMCFFLFQLVQDFTIDLPLKSYWSRILFSLGSQKCNCKSTTGILPWLSAGKAKGPWGILSHGIYSLQLQAQGAPGVWGVTAPVPWEAFRNRTHTAHWIHSTRIQKVSIPINQSSIQQQNQMLCICRHSHGLPSHLKHCFIQRLKSATKQRMSSEWGLTHSCLIKIYKYSHFILIAIYCNTIYYIARKIL